MPTAQSEPGPGRVRRSRFPRAGERLRVGLVLPAIGTILACSAPQQSLAETPVISRAVKTSAEKIKPSPSPRPNRKKWGRLEGNAVWYDVPVNSLAKRRAGKGELTAAHNRLPLGTKVRVTHLANGKSVIVRITDRGITVRRAIIDLCKEAAETLDMVREGSARVRLEILPDDRQASAPADSNTATAHP
jgi:rare lipoprotein A (peptidoglycan hydrolase)